MLISFLPHVHIWFPLLVAILCCEYFLAASVIFWHLYPEKGESKKRKKRMSLYSHSTEEAAVSERKKGGSMNYVWGS